MLSLQYREKRNKNFYKLIIYLENVLGEIMSNKSKVNKILTINKFVLYHSDVLPNEKNWKWTWSLELTLVCVGEWFSEDVEPKLTCLADVEFAVAPLGQQYPPQGEADLT